MHLSWAQELKVRAGSLSFLVLVACSTAVSVDPPWIPSAADVEIVSVSHFKVDGRGDVSQVGGAVQINAEDVAFVLSLLSTLTGSYVDKLETTSPQECSIAIDGRERMLVMARIGADWIAFVDDHHRASDGYSLVTRMRSLSVGERFALAGVCNVMDATSRLTIRSTRP
jgi:hypothetical protein